MLSGGDISDCGHSNTATEELQPTPEQKEVMLVCVAACSPVERQTGFQYDQL